LFDLKKLILIKILYDEKVAKNNFFGIIKFRKRSFRKEH